MSRRSRKLAPARRFAAVLVVGSVVAVVLVFVLTWQWWTMAPLLLVGVAALMYRSATALLPVCVGSVPAPARAFQPRDDLRASVDAARVEGRDIVLTSVTHGPGGVGMSQLAAWYAHQAMRAKVDLVVWVDPTGPGAVMTAFAMAAVLVDAPGHGQTDPEQDAEVLLDWLSDTDRTWLVVFDGITDPAQVAEWWPERHSPTGWFLATTRLPGPIASAGRATPVEVGTFGEEESRAYLTARLAGDGSDAAGIDEVARRLGHLPLALSHAAAYMVNEGVDCREYLVRLANQRPFQGGVTSSALLAAEAANAQEPVGLALPALRLAATLDPAAHPADVWDTPAVAAYLADQRTSTTGRSSPERLDGGEAVGALAVLDRYGLVSHDPTDLVWTVRMHADTATAVRVAMPVAVHRAAARAAADAVLGLWPDPDAYPDGAAYVAVLRANAGVLAGQPGDPLWHPDGHELLFRAGMSLTLAELPDAESYWRAVVTGGERVLGPQHDGVMAARLQVAIATAGQGRTDEALPLFERLVADLTRVNGERDESTLTALEHLAIAATITGRTREAVQVAERLVAGRHAVHSSFNDVTLKAHWVLATCYRRDGRPDDAITSIEPVVAGYTATLGPDHPNTRSVRETLAMLQAESRQAGDGTEPQRQPAEPRAGRSASAASPGVPRRPQASPGVPRRPQASVASGGRLPGMPDHGGVQVESAEIVESARGGHFETVAQPTDHGDVEGAGTEVVDEKAPAGRQVTAQDGDEVRGGGDRLRHESDLAQPGLGSGVGEDAGPGVASGRRVGQHPRSPGWSAGDPAGLVRDPGQHRRHQVDDGVRPLAEPDRAVVDAPLRVRLLPPRGKLLRRVRRGHR